ncbi:MBL fold metallo-hydrolase [Salinarimonas sp.]|uniref:MBL fold metallo-hydrolase n=1 Tax=Salinarimonas sp. TaxID=2766526 RepID=UPI0032D974B6
MRVRVIGCGDAFGSGGRFNTCFLVERGEASLCLDFGATSLVALKRAGVDPGAIAAVAISHLHGDHFGGLPFLILDQMIAGRTRPLVLLGPPGLAARLEAATRALYPGAWEAERRYGLDIREIAPGATTPVPEIDATLTTALVEHQSGAPATALRLACDGRILAYSGDTGWVDTLPGIAAGADLFFVMCYRPGAGGEGHLGWETLAPELPALGAKRVVLTHMSEAMLAEAARLGLDAAQDGMTIEV